MQFASSSHSDNVRTEPEIRPWPPTGAGDDGGTLDLVQSCVEAMGLLQAKFNALEVETKIKLDATQRELGEMRSALADAQSGMSAGLSRIGDSESRIAQLESGAAEAAKARATDLAEVRAEAATWRMRVETDAMGFDHLTGRLTALEDGLAANLAEANQEIVLREAETARLRLVAEAAQTHTERLQTRLRDLDATIADQRSRINCLQSKLATATYAIRIDHMTRGNDVPAFADDRGILDLTASSGSRISAA